MQNYAILIDGGFAKRKLGTHQRHATADDFRELIEAISRSEQLAGKNLHRVYYYDASPLQTTHKKPLGGAAVEFAKAGIANRSKQLFDALIKLPYVALRLGELSFNGWEVKQKTLDSAAGSTLNISHEDLSPKISQKGVDMRIGMDIAALTLKKQVEIIVLVTGDSDFVPAMKFARREGAQLFLAPMKHSIRQEMYEHSDIVLSIEVVSAT